MTAKRRDPYPLMVLRQEIESVDREIVLLLAARLDAAERAIRERVSVHRHVTDREQEARVFERSRAWADELGLPRKLIDNLFRSLVEEGKARFLINGSPRDSPVVTVLLASPDGRAMDLGSAPHSKLVSVPTSR
jgi:chorismate mutase